MERSSRRLVGATFVLDLGARLCAPASVLALAHGRGGIAAALAVSVGALGVLRGWVAGLAVEQRTLARWQAIAGGVSASSVMTLRTRSPLEQGWRIVDAVHNLVNLEAHVHPRLLADGAALLVVAALVTWRLGPAWLIAGILLGIVLGGALLPLQRAIRRAEMRAWDGLDEVGANLDALLDAAVELRVHGRQEAVREHLLGALRRVARERRRVELWSATVGLVPVSMALLAVAAPLALGVFEPLGLWDVAGAEVGALGGAGLIYALGIARGLEAQSAVSPHRTPLARWTGSRLDDDTSGTKKVAHWNDALELRHVGLVHPGADVATPADLSLGLDVGCSLAITGPNGAGKSSLGMLLLGLVAPTSGEIVLDGAALSAAELRALHPEIVYVPQRPFLAEDRTVGWHLRLLAKADISDDALRVALAEAGLEGPGWLSRPMSELSGGERQRASLARLFLTDEPPRLLLLDEPEASLDERGREWLRDVVETCSERSRVVVIAHDTSWLPPSFKRLRLDEG